MKDDAEKSDVTAGVGDRLIAESKILARARKGKPEITLAEFKAVVLALSKINWKYGLPTVVNLRKAELAEAIGIKSDKRHLSVNLRRALMHLPEHSAVHFADRDKGLYADGVLVTSIEIDRTPNVKISFNAKFAPLLSRLASDYITMRADDLLGLNSVKAVRLYEFLRMHSDTRVAENSFVLTTLALKELFGIPWEGKGSYMTSGGHFKRDVFENQILAPVLSDLAGCRMLKLIEKDGSFYEKIKSHNVVEGYQVKWKIENESGKAEAIEDSEYEDLSPEDLEEIEFLENGLFH